MRGVPDRAGLKSAPEVTNMLSAQDPSVKDEGRSLRFHCLPVGMDVGPVEFRVRPESHKKHGKLHAIPHPVYAFDGGNPLLFPFETWSMPRALSSVFGPLNELVHTSATWRFLAPVSLKELLQGIARIQSSYRIRQTPRVLVSSSTYVRGRPVLETTDELLMLADTEPSFRLKSIPAEHGNLPTEPSAPGNAPRNVAPGTLLGPIVHRATMRMDWTGEKWRANIHCDEYARRWGLRAGAVEGFVPLEYMIGLLLEVFGLGFYDGSVLHAKFLRALHPGDWVRTTGRVLAALLADADRPEVLVELRVESLSGVPAVTAVCFVPYRSNNSDLK